MAGYLFSLPPEFFDDLNCLTDGVDAPQPSDAQASSRSVATAVAACLPALQPTLCPARLQEPPHLSVLLPELTNINTCVFTRMLHQRCDAQGSG